MCNHVLKRHSETYSLCVPNMWTKLESTLRRRFHQWNRCLFYGLCWSFPAAAAAVNTCAAILTMRKFPMRAVCYTRVYQLNIGFYAITQAWGPSTPSRYIGISSHLGAKLGDWAVRQAEAGCYSWAALPSNDSKTLYVRLMITEIFM